MKQNKLDNQFKDILLSDCFGYFEVNLTKNHLISDIMKSNGKGFDSVTSSFGLGNNILFTTFIEKSRRDYVITEKNEFEAVSNCQHLIECYRMGQLKPTVSFWTMTPAGKKFFLDVTYYLYSIEGDVIALAIAKDNSFYKRNLEKKSQLEGVVSGLASEYRWILYVDVDRDVSYNFRISDKMSKLMESMKGFDAFSQMTDHLIMNYVVEEDRQKLIDAVSKQSLKEEINEVSAIYERFRIYMDGEIHYYLMKITKDNARSFRDFVIIGLKNIDVKVKKELEHEEEVNQIAEITEVLASDYGVLFYVDIENDVFKAPMQDERSARMISEYFGNKSFSYGIKNYINHEVYKDDRKKLANAISYSNIKKQLADRKSFTVFYRIDNDGKPRYFHLKIVKVGDDEDVHAIALGFADRHDEIRKEEHRKQLMEVAKRRAEAANNAKTVFLFNMSHDIRTPMNAIMGYTEMAKKYINQPEKVSDCLSKLEMSGEHLLKLINDVLDMARIESGKVVIEEEEINLYEYVGRFIDIVSEQAEKKNITFTTKYENINDVIIFADAMRVGRVALNITSNAIKYTKPGGKIDFTIKEVTSPKEKEGYISFDMIIQDDGIGMSEDFIRNGLFENFARQNTSTISGIQGTGLGMSIAKNLIELMGGSIDVESKMDVGTTVTCHFHFRKVVNSRKKVEEENKSFDLIGKRVLLVEDNDLNREIAKDTLESEGIIVDEATDGDVAVEMVARSVPGYYMCVLMDIQMPRMDGYKATQVIRQLSDAKLANIPVIAMTANAFSEDRKKSMESGMNAHLAKPVKFKELMETISTFNH